MKISVKFVDLLAVCGAVMALSPHQFVAFCGFAMVVLVASSLIVKEM